MAHKGANPIMAELAHNTEDVRDGIQFYFYRETSWPKGPDFLT